MDELGTKVSDAASEIRSRTGVDRHELALVLGSGWGKVPALLGPTKVEIPAEEVVGFFGSRVPGHQGKLLSVTLPDSRNALIVGSRTHLYENKGVEAVVHPVHVAAACGAQVIVLTNGAGAIRTDWTPGQAVLISDHINLTGVSPLEGPEFVDLTDLYSKRLRDIAREVDSSLEEGVYVQFRGPQYETPAEIRMAEYLGGDLVGMSTALEAIAARRAGLEILGLSLVTNLAAGIATGPLNHDEVLEVGKIAEERLSQLLPKIVERL